MTECAFHPENHSTAELGVSDPLVEDTIRIPICEECVDAYDNLVDKRLREQAEDRR